MLPGRTVLSEKKHPTAQRHASGRRAGGLGECDAELSKALPLYTRRCTALGEDGRRPERGRIPGGLSSEETVCSGRSEAFQFAEGIDEEPRTGSLLLIFLTCFGETW